MKRDPLCYVVKSSHANFWFSVERGLWVERKDVTRFNTKAHAVSIARSLRGEGGGNHGHRIYVAAVYKKRKPPSLDNVLEQAFWNFDALHKSHCRDADPSLPGPMSQRDAFKRVARGLVTGLLPSTEQPK